MGLSEMWWRANVQPPEFKVGDEACYWRSDINHTDIVTAVRQTMTLDEDETFQEIMVKGNPYWTPASRFVRVRKVS